MAARSDPIYVEKGELQLWEGRGSRMAKPHLHNEMELNYIDQGSLSYLMAGRLVRVPAGRMVAFWAAIPHQLIEPELQQQMTWVTVPLTWLMHWELPKNFVGDLLEGGLLSGPRGDEMIPLMLKRWNRDWTSGQEPFKEMVIREVQTYLHRLALEYSSDLSPQPGKRDSHKNRINSPIHHVERLASLIARHYAEPITISDLAHEVGLHPNYAMQLFRSHCGMTLNEYLTRQRINHAQRLLATTTMGVVAIGLACGYNSISRFYEAFKNICHQTPRTYRQQFVSASKS